MKTTTKTAKKVNTIAGTKKTAPAKSAPAKSAVQAIRKSVYAYIGLYGAAYERAQPWLKSAANSYDAFAKEGEAMEKVALASVTKSRKKAGETFAQTKGKVMSILPVSANDRVEELEAEIARLNRKLKTKARKTAKKVPTKKVSVKKMPAQKASPAKAA